MGVRLLALALAGCVGGYVVSNELPPPPETTDPEPPPGVGVEVVVPAAFDPLYGALPILILAKADAEVTIRVAQDGIELWSTSLATSPFDVYWDGKSTAGAWAHGGRVEILVTASADGETSDASAETFVVRAAFTEARLVDDDGATSLRVPLYWAADQELQSEAEPISVLADVDDGVLPLDFPAVDLASLVLRPDAAEPAAYRSGDQPILELVPAEVSPALGPTAIGEVEVYVEASGWINLSGGGLSADEPVVFMREEGLPSTLGVTAEDVVLTFWVPAPDVGEVVIAEQRLPLRFYRLLDESQFEAPAERYEPWVAVVDPALTAIEGTTADADAALDALVDFVYLDLGLEYDTVAGASVYSTYQTGFFDGPHFYLSDFLARKDGDVINCSDAANILGAYANMVGVRLDHLIIEPGFDLNYIQAIGYTVFTSCPFGPGGCAFSYHAVTTYTSAFQIWDATLALDGDADPGALPNVELLVQSIDSSEYLDRLVRDGNTGYGHQAQETLE